jgi:hypothetical protein
MVYPVTSMAPPVIGTAFAVTGMILTMVNTAFSFLVLHMMCVIFLVMAFLMILMVVFFHKSPLLFDHFCSAHSLSKDVKERLLTILVEKGQAIRKCVDIFDRIIR